MSDQDDRTVLVVARERDSTADLVIRQLAARGVGVLRLDTERLPERCRSTVTCDGTVTTGRMELSCGHEMRTEEITAVWYRPPAPSAPAPEMLRLIRAPWVNDPRRNASAAYRPTHLRVAAELGLRTPRTMVTNDPEAARDFAFRCGGRAVVKTVRATLTEAGQPAPRRTGRPGGSGSAAPQEVRYAPCLLQERLVRRSELRVTVVGSRVFGVEIGSRNAGLGHEDWRHSCREEFPLRPYPLPAVISDRCLALCRHFGLAFATFDFAVAPDGDHVFLEIDPHGEWSWIADLTGLPIAGALADLLADRPGAAPDR